MWSNGAGGCPSNMSLVGGRISASLRLLSANKLLQGSHDGCSGAAFGSAAVCPLGMACLNKAMLSSGEFHTM